MTTYQEERPYSAYAYARPPSAQGGLSPPERMHSSQSYSVKGTPNQQHAQPPASPYQSEMPSSSRQPYPSQPPMTPISGSSYPPQGPPSTGYYGVAQTPPADLQHVPSPPPSSNGRPTSQNFTPDGVPIVPVGISGGKMFRCRGYGECDKVFTRSEHLARHVRKHTGERPFPCHCGKSFSRLDNLRQHAATVHSDQTPLNDAMLNALAPVHAALSQRANRDQRKRGEIVEVPKNAVERPRHSETFRGTKQESDAPVGGSPYPTYGESPGFSVPPPQGRPRTSGGYDYPYPPPPDTQPPHMSDDAGPSRRPSSGYAGYPPPVYYEQAARPPTAPGSAELSSQLPYPYRPMSSNGRELPLPVHYSESEPPSSAHGVPPQSPMYPPPNSAPPHPQAHWSSPPAPPPGHFPPPGQHPHYPPAPNENYTYPPPPSSGAGPYGPPLPPPGAPHANYSYPPPPPPPGYGYNTQPHPSYGPVPAAAPGTYPPTPYGPPPPPSDQPPSSAASAAPSDSPFHYSASSQQQSGYPQGSYEGRKRRAEDNLQNGDGRKVSRTIPSDGDHHPHQYNDGPRSGQSQLSPPPPPQQEALWLPPTTERRSSLAISALLGSPQQAPRSRPSTADVGGQHLTYGQNAAYGYSVQPADHAANGPAPSQMADLAPKKEGVEGNMEQKAKALLSQRS